MVEKQTKVVVSGETSKYERSMKRIAAFDKKITRDMQYRWNKVKSVMTGMVGKVAALAGIGGMIMLGKRALETGDIIHKLNLRLGISTETLSELQHVSNLSGVSFQTTAKSYQKMSENISDAAMGIGTAKDSIADLNMDLSTLHAMSPEKQFEAIADAMTGVVNQSDKIRIAADIFGGRGVEMLQIMDKGASGIREMRDQAQRLGMTLSQDAANSIAAFNDAMERFKGAVMGAARSIMAGLGPELTFMVDWFGEEVPRAVKRAIYVIDEFKATFSPISVAEAMAKTYPELEAMAEKERAALRRGLEGGMGSMGGDITPEDTERLASLEADKNAMIFASLERQWTMEEDYANKVSGLKQRGLAEEQAIADAKHQIAVTQGMAALSNAQFIFAELGKKNKAAFQLFKAFAIAETVIDTYRAAQGAYAALAGIPIVGPALAVAAAAAAIGAGMARVSMITAMQPGGGAGGGGGGGAVGTYPASPTTGLPEFPGLDEAGERRGSVTININGPVIGDEAYIDDLVERINAAEDRDVFINQTNYATELT